MEDEVVRRRSAVTPGQVLAVIFGRKWIFLGVFAAVFLISILVLKFGYEDRRTAYECTFTYTSEDLNKNLYPNGQSFKVADLLDKDNLDAIKADNTEFADINTNALYSGGASIALVDSENHIYKLTIGKKFFSSTTQAINFVKAVVEQPDKVIASQIQTASTETYLKLYDESKIFEKQVVYLNQQKDRISQYYDIIISAFGDVRLKSGIQLSEAKINFISYFENYSFSSLTNEIRSNGYVKEYGEYKTSLESTKSALEREKALDKLKLDDLIDQRDHILAAAGSLQTLELTEYNENIIQLTLRMHDIDEELNVIDKKLDNYTKIDTDDEYKARIQDLEERLAFFRAKLEEFTVEYKQNANEATESHSFASYGKSQIVTTSSGLKIYYLIGIPLVLAFLAAALVNIVLDGKKLTSKYRLVPVEMIKTEPETKEEKEENKKEEE